MALHFNISNLICLISVDGLTQCNLQAIRDTTEANLNASQSSSNKFTNVSNVVARVSDFPFAEGVPFTASLWAGIEGFHMTVNGRHETSFAYREVNMSNLEQNNDIG